MRSRNPVKITSDDGTGTGQNHQNLKDWASSPHGKRKDKPDEDDQPPPKVVPQDDAV